MSDVHKQTVITAAAGSGKTVQIVRRYLHELSQGVKAPEIVAITFTRKAAAELVERISRMLRFGAGLPVPMKGDEDLYESVVPTPEICLEALKALPSAPVSTVDSFVHGLVSEFLLDAAFECPDGTEAWIDGPLSPASNDAANFEEAARDALELVDSSGTLNAHAAEVLARLSLSEAIADVALLAKWTDLTVYGNQDILNVAGSYAGWMTAAEGFESMVDKACGSSPEGKAASEKLKNWKTGPPPPGLLTLITDGNSTKGPIKDGRSTVVTQTINKLIQPLRIQEGIELLEWKRGKGWHYGDAMQQADDFRAAIWQVSRTARTLALTRMAQSGEADHTELLRVATRICTQAKTAEAGSVLASLANRYQVLMVDEVQDTNRDQLDFYKAIYGMRDGMSALFVGDVRQSIYRFRGGDPRGWKEFIDETPDAEKGELDTNYRSSHALVEFQKCLFERLGVYGENGVASLKSIDAHAKPGDSSLGGLVLSEPVVVVDLSDEDDQWRVPLAAFARRLGKEWQSTDQTAVLPQGVSGEDTAAVLVRNWRTAGKVARELADYGIQAQLVGDKSLLSSRVATDLRLWLRALLDTTDEVAWLGMMKHPSIGLPDSALAHLRPYGGLLVPDDEGQVPAKDKLASIDPADAERLRAVMPLISNFRLRIGRESTAALLEELIALFQWRPIMAAGPEGIRAVAELDILLDAIRGTETSIVDPEAVISTLMPKPGNTDNLAKVRLEDEAPTVVITTVHSSKGLEYDHVCLLEIHKDASDGVHAAGKSPFGNNIKGVGVIESASKRWLAVKIDPDGGLHSRYDPLTGLAKALARDDQRDEGYRLLYVGVTRAAKTLTVGVPPSKVDKIRMALGLAGLPAGKDETPITESVPPGVMVLSTANEDQAPLLAPPPKVLREFSEFKDTGIISSLWKEDGGRDIRSPSSWHQGQRDGGVLKAAYLAKAQLVAGSKPAPPVSMIEHLSTADQGTLVHGWLEAWAFDGEPTVEAALAFLGAHWNSDDASLAQALCDIGAHMLTELPSFSAMLKSAKKLHFELPLLAQVGDDILTGLADLVIDHEDGTTTVIDFKAGPRFAKQGADGPLEVPDLYKYCWQLEVYKTALEAAGRTVKETGLVYVRGPSWVRF